MYGLVLSSFLFLFSPNNCLHPLLWTMLILSLFLFCPLQLSSEDQSVNGWGGKTLAMIWMLVIIGVLGIPMLLGRLEGTNRFAMVVLFVGHIDITITGFIELNVVGRVGVIMEAAVVLGAEVEGFSILTLYCLLLAWWFLLLFLMSLAFLSGELVALWVAV